MKIPLLLLATFGEWLGENAIAAIGVLITWLVSIAGLIWKISKWATLTEATGDKVEALKLSFERHEHDLDGHVKDSSVHTTFEQRQAINARFDKIEHSIIDGHNRIENKVDRVLELIFKSN